MTTKHTPGPWFPVPYGDGEDTVICQDQAGIERIAFMALPGCRDQKERAKVFREIKANARLIAAAPELLDALEALAPELRIMSQWVSSPRLQEEYAAKYQNARAAIAKARGEA